jgi:hypothetical protein
MAEIASGGGPSPSPSTPAEWTSAATPARARRRANSASAIGDRQVFTVHSTRMSVTGRAAR